MELDSSVVVLLSGGPDSATAAYLYHDKGYRVHCLTLVNNERGANCIEVECAKSIASGIKALHTTVDVSHITDVFRDIPNIKFAVGGGSGGCSPQEPNSIKTAPLSVETMHMLSIMYAVSHNIGKVVWSLHYDDLNKESPEDVKKYLYLLSRLTYLRTGQLCEVEVPFLEMAKFKILLMGNKLGVPFGKTFSCAGSEEFIHCGRCDQCRKRINAFETANLVDPVPFSNSKVNSNLVLV